MHFPTWVDLKGEDAVAETVHHVIVNVNPQTDRSWQNLKRQILTDGVMVLLLFNYSILTTNFVGARTR